MHQNSAVKSITFQWIFGAFGFPEVDFQVFCVFWMVLVIILRISMDFKAFWTGPSLARVHLPMHFIDFLDFTEFPLFWGTPPPFLEIFAKMNQLDPGPKPILPSMG